MPSTVMFVLTVNTGYGNFIFVLLVYAIPMPASILLAFAYPSSLYVSACVLICPPINDISSIALAHPISLFALSIAIYVVDFSFLLVL